jgi:plasmid stabilization system protein ParE
VGRVELTAAAVEDLDRLIRSHSLPADTRDRLRRSVRLLERFPLVGAELSGRWSGFRFILGPWRWMVLVDITLEDDERIVIVTIQDGRSTAFA